MSAHRNVRESEFRKAQAAIKTLQTAAPLNSASVSYGRQRFIGGELLGEDGAEQNWHGPVLLDGDVRITESLKVGGTLEVTADSTFEDVDITNTLDVTAAAKFESSVEIKDTLDVTATTRLRAATTVEDDLSVIDAGKVKVGTSMTLDPGVSSGAVVFSNGSQVFTDGSSIQVYKGSAVVQLEDDRAKLQMGGLTVVLDVDGIHLNGGRTFVGNSLEVASNIYAASLPKSSRTDLPPNVVVWEPGTQRLEVTI